MAEGDHLFLCFVASLSRESRRLLLDSPSSCLVLFRLLPSTAQQLVLKLLWNSNVSESLELNTDAKKAQVQKAVEVLRSLDFLEEGENWKLKVEFRRNYLKATMLGAFRAADIRPVEDTEVKTKKVKDIAKKATERWECILRSILSLALHSLRYLALPSKANRESVSDTTRKLLLAAAFTSSGDDDLEITSSGFQFLLLSPVQQMWTYLIGASLPFSQRTHSEYLKMEAEKEGGEELLPFLLRLIACAGVPGDPEKRAWKVDEQWSHAKIELLYHLRELGLIFMRKRKDGFFFVTPYLTSLTGGISESTSPSSSGFIIVETNFRVYAYTASSLRLAILSTFTEMTYRFNDMSVGVLTRDSVRRALQVGITAVQIVSFLRANAHPQTRTSAGLLNCVPITVADQIALWEDERKRLVFDDATLYSAFDSDAEFTGVRDFARSRGILLWSDANQKIVIVHNSGHELVKAWWNENKRSS